MGAEQTASSIGGLPRRCMPCESLMQD